MLYNISDFSQQLFNNPEVTPLGSYKSSINESKQANYNPGFVPGKDLIFDAPNVQPRELLGTAEWLERFYPYESLEALQAKSKAKVERTAAEALERKLERERRTKELSAQQLERKKQILDSTELSVKNLVYKSTLAEIENGTPDGGGRSHLRAFAIAANVVEAEKCAAAAGIALVDTAEQVFEEWINNTFTATEKDKIDKVWGFFRDRQEDTTFKPKQTEYLEDLLARRADKQLGADVVEHLLHGRNFEHLLEASSRGLVLPVNKEIDISKLPVLFDTNKQGWGNVVSYTTETSLIYVTSSPTYAQKLLKRGTIYGVVLFDDSTPSVLVHQFLESVHLNKIQLVVDMEAPNCDRLLAAKLRSGHYSELCENARNKKEGSKKLNIYKPEVVVVDREMIVWGAQYYWQRQTAAVTAELVGSRKDKDAVIYGFTGNERYFSDIVAKCETTSKNRKLLGFVSEMGTGKTEVLARVTSNWDSRLTLAIAHRELLTKQAAHRLGLVYYKDKDQNAKDKYQSALVRGLAITANTLVQGGRDQAGYLPDFKIDDWAKARVVIDEAESFMKYLMESGTLVENRQGAIEYFIKLIKTVIAGGGQVILSDANLRTSTIQFFEKIACEALGRDWDSETKSADFNCYIIHNSYKKFTQRKLTVIDSPEAAVSEMMRRVEASEKILYFTDVKAPSKKNYFSTQSLGMFCREVQKLGHLIDADTRGFTDDVDHKILESLHTLIKHSPKIIIAVSPVIDSGTDWNNLGMNSVWASYTGIMGLDSTLQQLERVRDDIPRFLSAAKRTGMGMSHGDITNLQAKLDAIAEGYSKVIPKLVDTWAEYSTLNKQECDERLAELFPKLNQHILDWWQESLLESYYAGQEFRINLVARLQEKGYSVEYKTYKVDQEVIDNLKDYGDKQRELKYKEVAEADLSLLDNLEPNQDTMLKTQARAKDLKSCLYAMGIDAEQWKSQFDGEGRIELVRRSLGRKSKFRRSLIYGFSARCLLSGEDVQVSEIVATAEDFRSAWASRGRSIKDTQIALSPGIEFLDQVLNIRVLVNALGVEAMKRGHCEGGSEKVALFMHNEMPVVITAHRKMVENRQLIKHQFNIDIDIRPERAASGLAALFRAIGFVSTKSKGRESELGKDKSGKGNVIKNFFLITEDALHYKIWQCWITNYKDKRPDFFKWFYNPSQDETGDLIWKNRLGIVDDAPEAVIQTKKAQGVSTKKDKQLELQLAY